MQPVRITTTEISAHGLTIKMVEGEWPPHVTIKDEDSKNVLAVLGVWAISEIAAFHDRVKPPFPGDTDAV